MNPISAHEDCALTDSICDQICDLANLIVSNFDENLHDRLFQQMRHVIQENIDSRRHLKNKNPVKHKTIKVDGIEIDKNIAPLIKKMWNLGIKTELSCENNVPENFIWISFSDQDSLNRFLMCVFTGLKNITDNEVYNHAFMQEEFEKRAWKYDITLNEYVDDDDVFENVTTAISVRFPIEDYEFVLGRLNESK